jgi:hypothetical protein
MSNQHLKSLQNLIKNAREMLSAESDLIFHSSFLYVCLYTYTDIVNPLPNIKQRLQHGDIIVTSKGTFF